MNGFKEPTQELDKVLSEQFETIELVNCNDLDVFLKVIMLSDKKNNQIIRADINNLMRKYIDQDESLKSKLIKNDYSQFDWEYIDDINNKRRVYYKRLAKQALINIFNESFDYIEAHRIINIVMSNAASSGNPENDKLLRDNIRKLFAASFAELDSSIIRFDCIMVGFKDQIITRLYFVFYENNKDKNYKMTINIEEFDDTAIANIVIYWASQHGSLSYSLDDTMEYVDSVRSE